MKPNWQLLKNDNCRKFHWCWRVLVTNWRLKVTRQTACNLAKSDIQITLFLVVALLIVSNLFWEIKFFSCYCEGYGLLTMHFSSFFLFLTHKYYPAIMSPNWNVGSKRLAGLMSRVITHTVQSIIKKTFGGRVCRISNPSVWLYVWKQSGFFIS